MKVEVVQGVEGASLYIDDVRVAGPKPWGGGKVIHRFEVDHAAIKVSVERERLRGIGRREVGS